MNFKLESTSLLESNLAQAKVLELLHYVTLAELIECLTWNWVTFTIVK